MEYTLEQKYQLIKESLLTIEDKDPLVILTNMMKKDFISMHGVEHHYLDGASFLVALKNNGLNINLEEYLEKFATRSIKIPGGICGYWGICGAVASYSALFSLIEDTNPLSNNEAYKDHMTFTSYVLDIMSKIGGPRCCKRSAYIGLTAAIKYANSHYNVNLPFSDIKCSYSSINNTCIKEQCPFYQK